MNLFEALLYSVFFPKTCAVCGKIIDENEALCDNCYELIERCDPIERCLACGVKKSECQCKYRIYHFDACIAPFINIGVARRALYAFKFHRKLTFSEYLYKYMSLCVKNEYRDISFDGICFVPMSAKKKAKRGYNQSEILAEGMAKILGLPLYNVLSAKHNKFSQHKLTLKQRFKNVKGLYSVKGSVRGKRLLLIDDIKTTGATLDECSKQLLLAGADGVYCVTALMTEKKKKTKGKK